MSRESPPGRELLVALNRAATAARLMSGAVHDVNNALQVIAGSVELIEQDQSLPPVLVKSLDRIRRQSERAAATLAELQAFAKASVDGRERFDVRECVVQAIALRRYSAARLGLTMDFRAEEGETYLGSGNAGAIQQAVLNVMVNAEQSMAGRPGTIRVAMHSERERVGVEIADSGPGLSEAARATLFEPFATTKAPCDGSGLGLFVTRSIVESFDGSVEIVSGATGTSVVLWLPLGRG